jgi:hypothetical protein
MILCYAKKKSQRKQIGKTGFCTCFDMSRPLLKGRSQITAIEKLMNEMAVTIQQKLPKIYSKDLMEELFRLPYTKEAN